MAENYLILAFGAVLIVASVFAKGIRYGMPPHREKPMYPATRGLRLVLLSLGFMSLAFGLLRLSGGSSR